MGTRCPMKFCIVSCVLTLACALTACSDPAVPDGVGIQILAGSDLTDTVSAVSSQRLRVRIYSLGKPVAGEHLFFEATDNRIKPTMLLREVNGRDWTQAIPVTTDSHGIAEVRLKFGTVAGPGHIAI